MKKINHTKEITLKTLAAIAKFTSQRDANSSCGFLVHQPIMSEKIKKLRKNFDFATPTEHLTESATKKS